MGFQSHGSPNLGNLGAGPMAKHKEYYKGEGGGFPQVQAMVSLVSPCLPMVHYALINLLFGLCRFM